VNIKRVVFAILFLILIVSMKGSLLWGYPASNAIKLEAFVTQDGELVNGLREVILDLHRGSVDTTPDWTHTYPAVVFKDGHFSLQFGDDIATLDVKLLQKAQTTLVIKLRNPITNKFDELHFNFAVVPLAKTAESAESVDWENIQGVPSKLLALAQTASGQIGSLGVSSSSLGSIRVENLVVSGTLKLDKLSLVTGTKKRLLTVDSNNVVKLVDLANIPILRSDEALIFNHKVTINNTVSATSFYGKGSYLTNSGLNSISNLTTGADQMLYLKGRDRYSTTIITEAGRNFIDDITTANQRITLGLGNVDNTSDSAKPISTLQYAALNLKASKVSPVFTGVVSANIVSANVFYGDGSQLSGIITMIPTATVLVDGLMDSEDKDKLGKIALKATRNDTDANLKNRENHTGSQNVTTITGLSKVATSGHFNDLLSTPNVAYTSAIPTATMSVDGLMDSEDKKKLDRIVISGVADNAVTSAKIFNGTITNIDIADNTITSEKINSIESSKIVGLSILSIPGLQGILDILRSNRVSDRSVSTYGNYTVHTFRQTGFFYTPTVITADVLIVGGGGAGGGRQGGGGGGGTVLYMTGVNISSGLYPVFVGAGGLGVGSGISGNNGEASSFINETAAGGGGGGGSAGRNGKRGGVCWWCWIWIND
jgi:hypothetical protein